MLDDYTKYMDSDDRITRFTEKAIPKGNIRLDLQALGKTLLITPDAVRKAVNKSQNIMYQGTRVYTYKIHNRILIDFETLYYFAVQENWNLYALTAMGIEHGWFQKPLENGGEGLYNEAEAYLQYSPFEDLGNAYNTKNQTLEKLLELVQQGTEYLGRLEKEEEKGNKIQGRIQENILKYTEIAAGITDRPLLGEDALYEDEKDVFETLGINIGGTEEKTDGYYLDEEDMYSSEAAYLKTVSETYQVVGRKKRDRDRNPRIIYLVLCNTTPLQVFEDWEEADEHIEKLMGFGNEQTRDEEPKNKKGIRIIKPVRREEYNIYTLHTVDISSYRPEEDIILNNGWFVKCRNVLDLLEGNGEGQL